MASIEIEGLPSAAPAADPWPRDELGDDSALGFQADEMFARQLDTRFAGEVRGLVTDPATGLAGRDPEGALAGIAETTRLLGELKDRYLAQAQGPRQKALLEPVIDRRLDRGRRRPRADRGAGDVGAGRPHRVRAPRRLGA